MIKEALSSIEGIGFFPSLSLILFVLVFLGMLWHVAHLDTPSLEHLSALPLDSDPTDQGDATRDQG
jgi:hypothetical protein